MFEKTKGISVFSPFTFIFRLHLFIYLRYLIICREKREFGLSCR